MLVSGVLNSCETLERKSSWSCDRSEARLSETTSQMAPTSTVTQNARIRTPKVMSTVARWKTSTRMPTTTSANNGSRTNDEASHMWRRKRMADGCATDSTDPTSV